MHIDVAAQVFYISGMKQNSHLSDPDRLLQAALCHAAFDGWTDEMVRRAGAEAGLSAGATLLAAPRGALDLIAHWSRQMDQQMQETLAAADLKSMKIRQRVTFAVQARLDAISPHEEAARRARARLMLHDAASLGAELIWATSDDIWRGLNDPSTDFNWYSKRAILSAVYTSSLAVWLNDETPDKTKAKAFLDRRIENVMAFEKAKASWRKLTADLPDPAQILSGLRYGGRRRA